MRNIVIVIPSHNEYYSLIDFIPKLQNSFGNTCDIFYIIVDDASTDNTLEISSRFRNYNFQIEIVQNLRKLGHGQSLLKGLSRAMKIDCDYILILDGDGQFVEDEISSAINSFITDSNYDILELWRLDRKEFWYRRLISKFLSSFISLITKKKTLDANTPIRCFNKEVLKKLLPFLPIFSLTPNFLLSLISRDLNYKIKHTFVYSQPRRGPDSQSVTWGTSSKFFPSLTLLVFCFKSIKQLIAFLYWRFKSKYRTSAIILP